VTPEQAEERFSDAVEGQLSAEERARFEAALRADVELAQRYEDFRATVDSARQLARAPEPGVDLLQGVQGRLRRRSRGRYYRDRFAEHGPAGRSLPLFLGLLVLAVVGLVWLSVHWVSVQRTPSPDPAGAAGTGDAPEPSATKGASESAPRPDPP
jgi:anti-sigma factor RsiW